MPVRKIPKNHIFVTGRHASSKSTGAAEFESPLENDYLTLLDFDPAVRGFEVQPVHVPVSSAPKPYVPDVLVHFHDAADGRPVPSQLTEVKSTEDFERNAAKYAAKFAAARDFAQQRGWVFVLKSDRDIRTPRLKNIKFLRAYRRIEPDEAHARLLLDTLLAQGGSSSADQLVEIAAAPDPESRAHLLPTRWSLVVRSVIQADWDSPFDRDPALWLPGAGA